MSEDVVTEEVVITSESAQVFTADDDVIMAESMEVALAIYRLRHDKYPETIHRVASQVWTIPSTLLSFIGDGDDEA